MDEVSKYRFTGVIIWLVLLVVLVPIWFGEPVNFKPEGYSLSQGSTVRPLVKDAYISPEEASQPKITSADVVNPSVKEVKTSVPQWIVRIVAYKKIKDANDLLGRLESDYEVSIKLFEATGQYSVRVGPYTSKAKAEQDKQKLDKMLYTKSEIVRL